MFESVKTESVVIVDTLLNAVNAVADRPSLVTAVHIVNEHLEVLNGLRRQAELQTPVNGVAELPYLGFRLGGFHCDRVLKVTAVLHLESFGAFKRERLALKLTVRADRQLNVFRQRIIERQRVFPHDDPVAVAVIVNLNVEHLIAELIENFHLVSEFELFSPKSPYVGFSFLIGMFIP